MIRWSVRLVTLIVLASGWQSTRAQTEVNDSIVMLLDSMYQAIPVDTSIAKAEATTAFENVRQTMRHRDWGTWRPDPQRAIWMALAIPGGGQIYNRKYWKLPIVYGGFVGCLYAMNWNNMMYKDYAQAYLDIMDDDPTTQSYNKFMRLNRRIDSTNEERYKTIFKKRKDRYRRWRDLSFFVMVGVYAISVIDAYVDAELSVFDISRDLSLKVRPAILSSGATVTASDVLHSTSLGVDCSINF